MSKWRSFSQGYLIGQRMVEDYQKAKKKRDLEEIANAQETDITQTLEATPEQIARGTAETANIAAQDAKEFGLEQPMDYRPVANQVIQKTGVRFLGKDYDKPLSDTERDRARQMAMAGVFEKHGDVEGGMRLRREIKSQERDDARWDRQTQQWAQEDEDRKKAKEYEEGRKSVFSSSRFGQNQSQFQQQMADYQKRLAEYEAAKASGKSGPELGVAPVAPTRPEYSVGDALADRAALIDHDARFGKLDAKAFGEFTDLLNRAQSEGYEKALRLAQSGAPVQEIAKAFNATGQTQFDPASVVSDKVVKGKDGVETRVIQYKDPQGNVRTINTVAELDALGKASDVYTRFYQSEQNRRGNEQLQLSKNADARAGAQYAQGQADRAEAQKDKQARADAAVAIAEERAKAQGKTLSDAERNAIRTGILEAVPKEGSITSDYKPDSFGTGGTAIQKDKNGNIVVTRVDSGKPGQSFSIAPPGAKPAQQSAAPTAAHINALIANPDQAAAFDAKFGKGAAQSVFDAAKQAPKAAPQAPSRQPAPRQSPAAPAMPVQAPSQAPATKPSVASVLGVSGNGGAMDAIMTNKAAALESAAAQLKQSQQVFAAVARSGDPAAIRQYQADVVQKRDALNRLLASMNDQQRSAVVSALGV